MKLSSESNNKKCQRKWKIWVNKRGRREGSDVDGRRWSMKGNENKQMQNETFQRCVFQRLFSFVRVGGGLYVCVCVCGFWLGRWVIKKDRFSFSKEKRSSFNIILFCVRMLCILQGVSDTSGYLNST